MCFRENNNGGSKLVPKQACECKNVSHNVNSVLCPLHLLVGDSPKVINVFGSEHLALFIVTSIQNTRKSTKTETLKQSMKSNKKIKAQTIQKTQKRTW